MVLPVSVPGTREGRLSPSRLGLRRSCFRSIYRSHAPTLTDLASRTWRPWDTAAGHKVCITVLRAAVQAQFTVNGNQTFEVIEADSERRHLRPETIAAVANAMDDTRNRVDPIVRFERQARRAAEGGVASAPPRLGLLIAHKSPALARRFDPPTRHPA